MEAIDEGVLAKILVAEGTADVPVNDLIAIIAADGEDPASVQAGGAPESKAEAPKAEPAKAERRRRTPTPGGGTMSYARVTRRPMAPSPPATSRFGPPTRRPHLRLAARPPPHRQAGGLWISAPIAGSGPRGRVIERESARHSPAAPARPRPPEARRDRRRRPPPATPAPAAKAPTRRGLSADQVRGFYPKGNLRGSALDGMRKTIAKRLTEAMQVAPHFYLTVDCELDALMALREQLNKSAGTGKDGKPPSSSR